MALFLGCLLLVFRHPSKKKLGLQLKNPDFVAVGGPRRVPPSSPQPRSEPKKPMRFLSKRPSDSVQTSRGEGLGSPENPWRKGWTYPYMKIGVKVMCFVDFTLQKKRDLSDKQKRKEQRDLNPRKEFPEMKKCKVLPRKFSKNAIGTFVKVSRHAWIIGVSKCPRRFNFSPPQKNTWNFRLFNRKGNILESGGVHASCKEWSLDYVSFPLLLKPPPTRKTCTTMLQTTICFHFQVVFISTPPKKNSPLQKHNEAQEEESANWWKRKTNVLAKPAFGRLFLKSA